MKMRLLAILLCLVLLFGVLPMGMFALSAAAEEVDAAETGEDYTDPAHPYVATTYNELKTFINKDRFKVFAPEYNNVKLNSNTYYVKLGANVSYSSAENGTLRTNGADIVLDLAGYTISYEDKSNYGNCVLAGTYGTLTVNDSRRYDYSAGKYVDGKIDYVYTVPYDDRNTATMCGDIILNGGIIVNRTKSKAAHSAYANLFYSKNSHSGYGNRALKMYGGVLEAQQPIYLGYEEGVAIFGGELRVKKDVGIMMYYRIGHDLSVEDLPTISQVKITNASDNEKVLAFVMECPESYNNTQSVSAFYSIFAEDRYAFVDDVIQDDLLTGVSYGAQTLLGPLFKSSYIVSPSTRINELKTTISQPSPGTKPSYNAYVPNGVHYLVKNFNAQDYKYGVRWSKLVGNTMHHLTPDSTTIFEANVSYIVDIMLESEDRYRYHFASIYETDGFINGNETAIIDNDDGSYTLRLEFVCPDKTPVTSLELTVPTPYISEQPAFSASAPSGAAYTVNTAYAPHGYWKNGVQWGWAYLSSDPNYSFTGISPSATSARFESGKAYSVGICVTLTDANKYTFANNLTATVNGKEATVKKINDVTYTVACVFKMPYQVTSVALTINEPVEGNLLNYTASVPAGADYAVEKDYTNDAAGWHKGIRWKSGSSNISYTGKETFKPGKRYTVVVAVVPKSDLYYFGRVSSMTATVNGQPATLTNYGDGSIGVEFTFVLTKQIDTLEVYLEEPQAGALMSYDAAVPAGAGYVVNDYTGGKWYHGVMWEDADAAYTPNSGNTFTKGDTYTVSIMITLADEELFAFAPGMSMESYLNGHRASASEEGNIYFVSYSYTVEESVDKTVINSLAITIPAWQVGGELPYEASAPAGLGYAVEDFDYEGMWKDGVRWFVSYKILPPDLKPTFEAEKTYTVNISIVLTDESYYRFADVEDITATVNGYEAEVVRYEDNNYAVSLTFTTPSAEEGSYLLGDADGDGTVTILDATAIQRTLASLTTQSFVEKAADADEDGGVTILDATAIQRWLASLPTHEGIGVKTV